VRRHSQAGAQAGYLQADSDILDLACSPAPDVTNVRFAALAPDRCRIHRTHAARGTSTATRQAKRRNQRGDAQIGHHESRCLPEGSQLRQIHLGRVIRIKRSQSVVLSRLMLDIAVPPDVDAIGCARASSVGELCPQRLPALDDHWGIKRGGPNLQSKPLHGRGVVVGVDRRRPPSVLVR
jgi:hypothetical protein